MLATLKLKLYNQIDLEFILSVHFLIKVKIINIYIGNLVMLMFAILDSNKVILYWIVGFKTFLTINELKMSIRVHVFNIFS